MSNTLNGFSNTLFAWEADVIQAEINKVLTPLAPKVCPFDFFAAKFSNLPSPLGTITIAIPTYPTSSQKNNFAINAAVTTQVTVPLDTDYTYFVEFNPVEVQNGGLNYLVEAFLKPSIYAIENQLQQDAFAIAETFATSSFKVASASAFSASAVIQINSELSDNHINGDRFLALNSDYFWKGIISDLSNKNNQAGADAIMNGLSYNPFRMTIAEAQLLTGASYNIIGFAGVPGGVIIGTAIPQVKHANGQALVVTSPNGVNLLVEQYYDEHSRQNVIGASVVGHVSKGNNLIIPYASS